MGLHISLKYESYTALLLLQFKDYGSVETVRLRGAARPDLKTTKKVAVITRKIHENRNNINAYVRFKVLYNHRFTYPWIVHSSLSRYNVLKLKCMELHSNNTFFLGQRECLEKLPTERHRL